MVKQTIRIGDCEIVYEADTPAELAAIMKSDEGKKEEKPPVHITNHIHPIVQTSHTPIRPAFAPNIQC